MADTLFDSGPLDPAPRHVHAISDARLNADRVLDLVRLGYLPGPTLDPTFGNGHMWDQGIPHDLVACDLHPDRARSVQCDFRQLPFADDTFGSVLYDPPYKYGGGATTERLHARYGIPARSPAKPVKEVDELVLTGALECHRVTRPGGYLVIKCQDQVSCGRVQWQTFRLARLLGEPTDMLLLANNTGTHRGRQVHARRNYSTFMVWKVNRG